MVTVTPIELLPVVIADVLAWNPGCSRVFLSHGMACVGCPMARFETVEEAARAYGFDPLAFAAALVARGDEPGESPA